MESPLPTNPSSPIPHRTLSPRIFIIPFVAILLIGSIVLLLTIGKQPKKSGASISGVINYTALKPDPTDRGELHIKYRPFGSGEDYRIATINPSPYTTMWSWDQAISGKAYEMITDLVIDGTLVTSSEPLIVTAPAFNQIMNLRVTWHNLPASVVSEQTAAIKGTVAVHGYIPPTSSLLIQAKSNTDASYQTVVTLTSIASENSWIWDKTTPLKDYNLQAILMDGGTEIGKSQTLTAAGGDNEIAFTINSAALPPQDNTVRPSQSPNAPSATPAPSQGTISGTVVINGPEQENTSLLLLWRNPGDSKYKEITRINNPSHNGQAWSWPAPTVGKHYDITAVLQVNMQNTASAQSQILTAPAGNIRFTINTGITIPSPNGNPSLSNCNPLGNNQYNAVLSYPRQSNAGNYWIQVGRSSYNNDVYNSKQTDNGATPQITVQIDGNRSYYTQFAYSLCKNCSEDQNFSNFSSSISFSCGGGTVYTGYICASNFTCQQTTDNNPPYAFTNAGLERCQRECKPTVTPTTPPPPPTSTPIPTDTPKIANCNESCGGNGYICANPYACLNQEGIGASVCRNINCPTEPTCMCE